MSNWKLLNGCRVPMSVDSIYGSTPDDGFNGFFCVVLNNCKVKCIASDGEGWRHVSVSILGSNIPPSWSIMAQVKDLFWEPEDCVVQYHPPHSEYVNQHPGVLHLWQPLNAALPLPPRLMVGVKDEADLAKVMADKSVPVEVRKATEAVFRMNQKRV